MRSFRTAAVAGLSALALTFSATVANAEETGNDDSSSSAIGSSGGFYDLGTKWDADEEVSGEDIFGEENTRNDADTPEWVSKMYNLTVGGVVASILGLVVFPAYNWAVYNGIIR